MRIIFIGKRVTVGDLGAVALASGWQITSWATGSWRALPMQMNAIPRSARRTTMMV